MQQATLIDYSSAEIINTRYQQFTREQDLLHKVLQYKYKNGFSNIVYYLCLSWKGFSSKAWYQPLFLKRIEWGLITLIAATKTKKRVWVLIWNISDPEYDVKWPTNWQMRYGYNKIIEIIYNKKIKINSLLCLTFCFRIIYQTILWFRRIVIKYEMRESIKTTKRKITMLRSDLQNLFIMNKIWNNPPTDEWDSDTMEYLRPHGHLSNRC